MNVCSVHNCDCKMAGNLSSIYQTLISLLNLAQGRFYHSDDFVNVFLEKMQMTIGRKVAAHEEFLARHVLGSAAPARILGHILADKFERSSVPAVTAALPLTEPVLEELVGAIIQQKFEQREPSGDVHDDFLLFLSGEQASLMEISYTKQQQKQKQKQQNKSQDSDTMDVFDRRNQVSFQRKNPDFPILKNPDFRFKSPDLLLRNLDFLLKNDDFVMKTARTARRDR